MPIILPYLLFIFGIVLIVKGGDLFVDAASFLARATGIPEFVIGATVVSVATTFPELLVSALAAREGATAFAIGNSVGSVSVNIGLILAILILFLPTRVDRREFGVKGFLMVSSAFFLWLFSVKGHFSLAGVILLSAIFLIFLWENLRLTRHSKPDSTAPAEKSFRVLSGAIAKFVLGAAGITVGARLLVDNGVIVARRLGVPASVIAVTVVSLGTSLPELVCAVGAIIKKKPGLSVGNILGACVIDLCLILPICTALSGKTLPLTPRAVGLDLPVCLGLCLLSVLPTWVTGKLSRWQGILLLLLYLVFCAFVVVGAAA